MQRDRVNGKGSAASSSAVPRRGRCSGGACSRSCSPPKASEVEQAGSPQAPIFGTRETSDTPLGATRVLDRGNSILIAVEDHVGGGERNYQAPEADSLERPQNSRAVSQGHGHDKKKKKKETNDAADTVATSSSTAPGNLFGAAPAKRTSRGIPPGIRHRGDKFLVEIRVAKHRLLAFTKIHLGSYDTLEQACAALNVGVLYCGNWPPNCVIDERILSSLPSREELDRLHHTEMMKQIQKIARCAARGYCTSAGTVPLWTLPSCGLINAAAAAPVQQQVEIEGGFSHFELDQAQRAAAAGDSQTLEAADQLEAAPLQEAAATNHVRIVHQDDQHSGDSWDMETPLKGGQVPRTDFLDQFPVVGLEENNTGNLQSDMELDQQKREYNLRILSDSTIPHNNVSTNAHHNTQESEVDYTLFKNHMLEADQTRDGSSHVLLLKIDWGHEHVQENQGDKMFEQLMFEQLSERYWKEMEAGQFLGAEYCDEMQF